MEIVHYCAALNKRFIVKGLFIFYFFPLMRNFVSQQSPRRKKTAVEWAEMNVKATDVVMNTLSLRRHRRAMEIDVAAESLIPLLLLRLVSSFSFCLQLTWVGGKSVRAHVGIYTKCTGCRCWSPRSLLKCACKTWNQTSPGTTPGIGDWTASDASRWTLDPRAHKSWCVLTAEPRLLNRSAAERPVQVAAAPFPLGALINSQEMHEQYDTAKINK